MRGYTVRPSLKNKEGREGGEEGKKERRKEEMKTKD